VARLDGRLAVSLRQIEGADFILAVGADPVHEAPMLALALRQAWRRGAPVAVLDPRPVFLPFEFEHLAVTPGHLDLALGAIVKEALGVEAAAGLSPPARRFFEALPAGFDPDPALTAALAGVAGLLARSRRPVLICGPDLVGEATPNLAADCALLLRQAGREAGLFYLLPGPNAFGAALLAAYPRPAATPAAPSATEIIEGIEQGAIKALVLVEADPFASFPDEARLTRALEHLELLLVLDYLPSPALNRAHVALPTLTLFERTPAAFVNQEGRVQQAPPVHFGGVPIALISPEAHPPRTYLNYVPGGDPRAPAAIFTELARELSEAPAASEGEDLWVWLAKGNPLFARLAALPEHPAGLRLLPEEQSRDDFAGGPVRAEAAPRGEFELLLVDWTFGTEELAGYSPLSQQVEPDPCLTMHSQDVARLGLAPGEQVTLNLPGGPLEIQVQGAANMAPGVLVLPRHRRLAWRRLPHWPWRVAEKDLTRRSG
jgi:NADH-quinone oxidoreductase subunit G